MEENKVTLSLNEFLKMHDRINEENKLLGLFLDCLELNNNNSLNFDKYNLSNSTVMNFLEKNYNHDLEVVKRRLISQKESEE